MKTVFSTDPVTIDPRRNGDVYSSFLQKMLFEGLTRLEEKGKVSLGLAENIEISEDGLTYRFHLRPAQWTDGRAITAYDFEYTWKKVLDPSFGAPCAFLFYPILNAPEAIKKQVSLDQVGIRALNAKTFEVVLSHPTPYFLSLISFCPFFPIPKHIDQATPQWDQTDFFSKQFVSSGPFQLVRWDRNNKIAMKKSPSYWDQKNVQLEELEVLIIPDEETALRLFEQGEIDLINSLTTPLSVDELVHLKDSLETAPMGASSFCSFNLSHPMLKNRNIRQALSLAIDRASIVENITQMNEEAASRYIPSTITKHKQLRLLEDHNPAKAKELFAKGLAELNHPAEIKLSLCYENKELPRRLAQAIQQQWKQVLNLEVDLQENEFKNHLANLERRHYDIGIYSWWVHYLDPLSILERFKYRTSAKNYPGFEHPRYISLLDEAQNTNDPEKRIQLMEEAESLIVQEMPLSPIFHFNQVLLKSNRFESIPATPLGDVLFRKVLTRVVKPTSTK